MNSLMPGLVPGIHVLKRSRRTKAGMAGSSPAMMTSFDDLAALFYPPSHPALLRQPHRPQREGIGDRDLVEAVEAADAPPWPAPILVRNSTGPPPVMVARSRAIHFAGSQ